MEMALLGLMNVGDNSVIEPLSKVCRQYEKGVELTFKETHVRQFLYNVVEKYSAEKY